ncbi:MAG: DUF2459 domain-containing protein [Epsilonproteobacteria bacterium]|nr:DUF2459 domain-containing protein [Campylobacterota bacterium]
MLFFPAEKKCSQKNQHIYVYHTWAHTEIMIPLHYFREDFVKYFPTLLRHNTLGYMAFSYGDQDFMMHTPSWSDINLKLISKALFINTPALVRVGHYRHINKKESVKIELSNVCTDKLKESILNSFSTQNEKFIRYEDEYRNPDVFYFKAKEAYSLFHTCNSWSGNRLRDAGLKVPYLTPFAQEVVYHYR